MVDFRIAYSRASRIRLKGVSAARRNVLNPASLKICVSQLRIEDAKRRLERTNAAIDQIRWSVGYEDAASFRRLFKRITGITLGDYRRKFSVPQFAQPRR